MKKGAHKMKALTIKQPYATAIAVGIKQFETRSWETKYRGEIAIHAGKSGEMLKHEACSPEQLGVESYEDLPYGAIVATAELIGCWEIPDHPHINLSEMKEGEMIGLQVGKSTIFLSSTEIWMGDYTQGRYAWQLANVKKLDEPIFVKGQQGLWEWDA